MRYYFETNALYQLKHIPNHILASGFTSVLSLVELISGITSRTYPKKKAVLRNIIDARLIIDWSFPQSIIMNCFDVYDDYEAEDERISWVESAVRNAIKSESYSEFSAMKLNERGDSFEYFVGVDKFLSESFASAIAQGYQLIKRGQDSEITIDGKTYPLHSWQDMKTFFTEQVNINLNVTVNALTSIMMKMPGLTFSREEIYLSYNGLVDIYVRCFSEYCLQRVSQGGLPARNDFQDLTHLLYLRNDITRLIVSNDNIYKKLLPVQCISIDELLINS